MTTEADKKAVEALCRMVGKRVPKVADYMAEIIQRSMQPERDAAKALADACDAALRIETLWLYDTKVVGDSPEQFKDEACALDAMKAAFLTALAEWKEATQ